MHCLHFQVFRWTTLLQEQSLGFILENWLSCLPRCCQGLCFRELSAVRRRGIGWFNEILLGRFVTFSFLQRGFCEVSMSTGWCRLILLKFDKGLYWRYSIFLISWYALGIPILKRFFERSMFLHHCINFLYRSSVIWFYYEIFEKNITSFDSNSFFDQKDNPVQFWKTQTFFSPQ